MEQYNEILFSGEKEKAWLIEKTGVSPESITTMPGGSLLWEKDGIGKSILLLFRFTPIGATVSGQQESKYKMHPFDGCKVEVLTDSICNFNAETIGTLRTQNEKLFLKTLDDIHIGDAIYPTTEYICKDNLLYGTNASVAALFSMMIKCVSPLQTVSCPVTVAFMNESVDGIEETLGLISKKAPDCLLICSAAIDGDLLHSGKGVGVCIKDGNCFIDKDIYQSMQNIAEENGIDTQSFVGDTKSSLSQLYLAAKTKKMAGFYLPVAGLGSRTEEISLSDVEKTQNLVLKYAETFAIIDKNMFEYRRDLDK